MKFIVRWRWFILLLWVGMTIALTWFSPSMGKLVREKGGLTVPEGTSSMAAAAILENKNPENKNLIDLVLVFHNPDALTEDDFKEAEEAVQKLAQEKEQLGVEKITSPFITKELEEELVSKDGKTILTLLTIQRMDRETAEIRDMLEDALKEFQIEHYLTGGTLVDEDVVINSEKGLHKTELITVILILGILLLVFRSPITPLVPLIIVGITYLTSQSIVAFLIDWWNFPVSQFTQIFLVAVLFGIGTDYCILLLSRFKEELAHQSDVRSAIIQTYKHAGRTVFFSALAALLGFALIGLATFKLYQSAVAVSVGVAILILSLFTLVPFFMAVLGRRLFWPAKGRLDHKESKLWGILGQFSLKRPWIAMALIAIIVIPLLATYEGKLSFNSLNEISDKYGSVKGFNTIAESFGPGEAMPTKIVIEHSEPLNTTEALTIIEKISREISNLPAVNKVRSATRPLGETLTEFQVSSQMNQLSEGLGKGNEGMIQIRDGLSEANTALHQYAPELQKAAVGIDQLVEGTTQLKEGTTQLQNGLTQIEQGLRKGTIGADQLKAGIAQAKINAANLYSSANQLLQGYQQLNDGLNKLNEQYSAILKRLKELSSAYQQLDTNFAHLLEKYPDLAQDVDFLTIQQTVAQARNGTEQFIKGLESLNTEMAKLEEGFRQANNGFAQLGNGLTAFSKGLGEIEAGMDELIAGIDRSADGQRQVLDKLPEMINGLDQLIQGQSQAKEGFLAFANQLGELNEGLSHSVDGLSQISDGITSAQAYLNDLSLTSDREMAGWYIPKEAINHEEFQQVFDQYMSNDRKVTTLDVILKDNPYSIDAIHAVEEIKKVIDESVKGTELKDIRYGVGGITGIFADLEKTSNQDYQRTMILMIIGVTIILIVLLRSLIMPLYLIAALLLCYFTSMSFSELLFGTVFHYDGLGWTIPFFGFVILLALGIDYSIFLMDRFNEYKHLSVTEAILLSMKKMGTVITSAAIILAGTFAAMYPSGVLSLLQIATVVLTGLILYALLFMPFFVPVMVKLFGRANWWPFLTAKKDHLSSKSDQFYVE